MKREPSGRLRLQSPTLLYLLTVYQCNSGAKIIILITRTELKELIYAGELLVCDKFGIPL